MARTRDSEILKTEYEVFLSFRGPDTRQGFTDVLYDHMKESGIQVFRDDDELAIGDTIELILDAIKNSKICVPIFSKSFASSAWCLREVAKMVELNKDIVPIFYDVTPDDVKLKTALYLDDLREQHKKSSKAQVEEWEKALVEVARIKGRELKQTGFVEFSKKFRGEILFKLGVKPKYTINHLVEMTDQIEEALELLDIESADVRVLGMFGMGGAGKTTLAKTVLNRISSSFDACSFLENIREEHSRHKGLEYLQTKLLQDLNPKAANDNTANWVERGKMSLRMKSVLIVLDDVGDRNHIRELVGDFSSFNLRSRIIITARDERVLNNVAQASSSDEGNKKLFTCIRRLAIVGMNPKQAMQLFSRHAFGSNSPPEDYKSLSEDVITISRGLPLTLEVIGSLLCGMSIEAWQDKVTKLKTIPAQQVQEKLMISYEALEDDAKEIFLDIACFFINKEKLNPIYMWEACGFGPNWVIPVLISMSLVKIAEDGKFWMHDQLKDLGREIVRIKGYNGSCSREGSRIQTYEDALYAVKMKQERKIVGLCLNGSDRLTDFTSFESLRFLAVAGEFWFPPENFWKLPENLGWLSLKLKPIRFKDLFAWNLESVSISYLKLVAIIDLSYSSVNIDWEGWILIQMLWSLKVLDLTRCEELTRTPKFFHCLPPELEKLILYGCKRLAKVDSSIGNLRKLKFLNLEECLCLRNLPEEVGNLENLEQIIITGSIYLSTLPDSIGKLKNLKYLHLRDCRELKKLPELIGDLRSLVHLDVSGSRLLKELPATIGRLVKLEHLSLFNCGCITKLPDSIGDLTSLVSLYLSQCRLLEELPSSITGLVKLQKLFLQGCKNLVQLPDDFGNLESLVELDISLSGVGVVPNSIGDLARLQMMFLCETPVTVLPETVAQLSLLQRLDLRKCHGIERLPKLPMSLTHLFFTGCSLREAPNMSGLLQLRSLGLDDASWPSARCSQSPQLGHKPFHFDIIREFTRLVGLDLHLKSVTSLPDEFSTLTRLNSLWLRCPKLKGVPQFPSSLQYLRLEEVGGETKLPCLSNLNSLSTLEFVDCRMEGEIFRRIGFETLETLISLTVSDCCKFNIFPHVSGLKCLQKLMIVRCDELVEIPGLGTLVSLKELKVSECGSLERLENIKNLTGLIHVSIMDCNNFGGIHGLEILPQRLSVLIWGCKCKSIHGTPGRVFFLWNKIELFFLAMEGSVLYLLFLILLIIGGCFVLKNELSKPQYSACWKNLRDALVYLYNIIG